MTVDRVREMARQFPENGMKLRLQQPDNVHELLRLAQAPLLDRIDFAQMVVDPTTYVSADFRHVSSDLVLRVPLRPALRQQAATVPVSHNPHRAPIGAGSPDDLARTGLPRANLEGAGPRLGAGTRVVCQRPASTDSAGGLLHGPASLGATGRTSRFDDRRRGVSLRDAGVSASFRESPGDAGGGPGRGGFVRSGAATGAGARARDSGFRSCCSRWWETWRRCRTTTGCAGRTCCPTFMRWCIMTAPGGTSGIAAADRDLRPDR